MLGLSYKSRLIAVKLLPLSLWLEAQNVILLVKLMIDSPNNFHTNNYISFCSSATRAATSNRIKWVNPLIPRLKV